MALPFDFLPLIGAIIGLGIGVVAVLRFGHILPVIPIINPWPITAIIHEKREKGTVMRVEPAKSWRNAEGEWYFQTKKSGLKTPPKPFSSILRGKDNKDYIYLFQPNREKVVSFVPDFDDDAMKVVIQDENTKNWERYQLRNLYQKMLKEQPWYVKNLPLFAAVIMIISSGFFLAIGVQPAIELTDASVRVGQTAVTIADRYDLLADRMERIANVLAGGNVIQTGGG